MTDVIGAVRDLPPRRKRETARRAGSAKQNLVAGYLRRWWPHAESAGAGRNGSDVTGTPGVVWEVKTAANFRRDFKPTAWVAQAKEHAAKIETWSGAHLDLPVVVYVPNGTGQATIEHSLAIVPLHVLMLMLEEGGWTP